MTRSARPTPRLGKDRWWHAYVDLGPGLADGPPRRRRKHCRARSKAECLRQITAAERDRDNGRAASPGAGTVADLGQDFVDGGRSSRAERTTTGYESHLRLYINPVIGSMQVEKVGRRDIERVYSHVMATPKRGGGTLSASTAQSVRRTLSVMFQLAVADGRLGFSPVTYARVPKVDAVKIQPPFSPSETSRLGEAVLARPDALRWVVAIVLGARQGESLAITLADVVDDGAALVIDGSLTRAPWKHGCRNPAACAKPHCRTKPCGPGCAKHTRTCPKPCPPGCTGHARCCPRRAGGGLVRKTTKSAAGLRTLHLGPQLQSMLVTWTNQLRRDAMANGWRLAPDSPLFPGPTGGWKDPRRDWQDWKQLLADAGLPDARLHDARHHSASALLDAGIDKVVIKEMFGWSSMSMIDRYQHAGRSRVSVAFHEQQDLFFGSTATRPDAVAD